MLALGAIAAGPALIGVACRNGPVEPPREGRVVGAIAAGIGGGLGPSSAGRTPDTLDELLAAVATGKEGDRLPARLEALFEREDDAVPAALAFVRAGKATKLVIDALAAAGTPAAQAGLGELARDTSLPSHVRNEAVASLVLVSRPSQATMKTVVSLIQTGDPGLRHAVLFVAGSVARAGREDFPPAAAAIERAVLAEYARAPGDDDQLEALAALGNLGSAAIVPRIRVVLINGEPHVRAAAARALRFVPDGEADRLLVGILRRDREPTVRAAALFAAGFRPIEPLAEGLAETAETDPVEYVRANAVTLLSRHLGDSPRVARAIGFVAHNDPAPGVRRLAREARRESGDAP